MEFLRKGVLAFLMTAKPESRKHEIFKSRNFRKLFLNTREQRILFPNFKMVYFILPFFELSNFRASVIKTITIKIAFLFFIRFSPRVNQLFLLNLSHSS